MAKSKVYFVKEINSENLIKIYEALGRELKGKVGVKISTGEAGEHHFLNPQLIEPLVSKLKGTIIECNTAYPNSKRTKSEEHWKVIEDHGFKAIAPCDIMDEFGEIEIPVENGFHLKQNIVGEHIDNYGSILMLSHFKGHIVGGFGGALKNMSIGIASVKGKLNQHSAGRSTDFDEVWSTNTEYDDFHESMADACKAVISYKGAENFAYINVANNLSVDCDCDPNPHAPEIADLGIYASLDPVAVDQACYDAVQNAEDEGKAALIERMDSRHGIRVVEAAAEHGLGSREYEIVEL